MKYLVFLLASLALAGCGSPGPDQEPEPGLWRGTLELPGGELPFGLELRDEEGVWSATLINGAERVVVPDTTVTPGELTLVLPAFNTRIDARRAGEGYAGTLTLVKRGGKKQRIPFAAEPGATHRFHARPSNRLVDVGGRWAVTFTEDDGSVSQAVAEFRQDGHDVEGTFLTPTGDYRFLAGEVHDNTLSLSTFDGSHAFLFRAHLDDGRLRGEFWSGTAWHELWEAHRDENAALPDADSLTQYIGDKVAFAFPDTTGKMVSFEDLGLDGKVVLITLAGSWCPNCHDEAAFMAELHERYRDRGLEIVGLMFEHLDDFDAAARQVEAYRDKFDIAFPLLVAGSSDKQRASRTMTMLDRVYAFPTTIFVDRRGTVRRVHTGFTGPGTGVHYEQLVASVVATVESLLEE